MNHPSRWVILKFGGTSVSSVASWHVIAEQLQARIRDGLRPVVVCSALSGVSNALEKLIEEALCGRHEPVLQSVLETHRTLADALELDADPLLSSHFDSLRRLAAGISLLGEASPRLHARVLAEGELMSTLLGCAWLRKCEIATDWLDARECLEANEPVAASEFRSYLSATCPYEPDEALVQRLNAMAPAVLTQGFIARNRSRETVLLGRGGSDTSAAYFAAKLRAERCEIWTDVPGMYTANPRTIPEARLLRALGYDEAQEIASAGAKVLHPRCISPAREHGIPLHIRCTPRPDLDGTIISDQVQSPAAQVKAISARGGVTLIAMETAGMWQQVGFLADIFAVFKNRGLSVDLVSTSEMNVTVSLDAAANTLDSATLHGVLRDLEPYCRASVLGPCAAVSLVGRHIRAILHRLAPALEVFEEHHIHLVSQAASDLNITFVVDAEQADRLVQQLHALLFHAPSASPSFGPSWDETFGRAGREAPPRAWWAHRPRELIELAQRRSPLYVYDVPSIESAALRLRSLRSVDRVLYAVKANPFPPILRRLHALGLGFECVSPGELDHLLSEVPGLDPGSVLFTPNFAPRSDYEHAFARGVRVTLDNLHPLRAWPELFVDRELFVRIDPGQPRGHHDHVRTAGTQSKFGIPPADVDELLALLGHVRARVTGLHAHRGSGIRAHEEWARTAKFLTELLDQFPDTQVLDLGGGLGVPERPAHAPIDLESLDASLQAVKAGWPRQQVWLEPGRYLVAEAGVLLARVTQIKSKGDAWFVGVDAGMNTLVRPALYGAWHEIVNLSRLGQPATMVADIVGPICESGDTLGRGRRIAPAREGDVMLIATAGAYGHAMSSRYNLREPAEETLFPTPDGAL